MIRATLLFLLVAGTAHAQTPQTWIARAREAIDARRYDTARIDLDRADAASPTADEATEIASLRTAIDAPHEPTTARPMGTWTHGVALGLFGGAAFAAGTTIAFGVIVAQGARYCDVDCLVQEPFFVFGVVSAVSTLVLTSIAAWLALEGPSIEHLVPEVSVSAEAFSLGLRGAF